MSIQVQRRRDVNSVIETVTPAQGEFGYDTTKKELFVGDGVTLGGMRQQKKNTSEGLAPAQITANTNDYIPAGLKHAALLELTTDASRNLTGLVPTTVVDTTDGRQIALYNNGAFNLVVQDQNAASSAANRFDLGGADITLGPKQSIVLRYNLTSTRWQIVGGNYGAAIADGAVSARKLAATSVAARAGMINGTIVASNAGGAASFALKTMAGADPSPTDPVFFVFQDGSGGLQILSQTSAASWGFSSGSSAGATNGAPFIVHHVVFNNAGSLVFGSVNCRSGNSVMGLSEGSPYSSTAEGGAGAADSAQVIYTAAAVASKYLCYLGRSNYESGLAAAGTWNVNPTTTVIWSPGMPKPGEVIDAVNAESGAVATDASANMPGTSDTAPAITNGSQALVSPSLTSKSKANLLEIDYSAPVLSSSVAGYVSLALFQDATSTAVSSALQLFTANGLSGIAARHRMASGVAGGTATVFKMRFGADRAGTTTLNGASSARIGAGTLPASITVRELQG